MFQAIVLRYATQDAVWFSVTLEMVCQEIAERKVLGNPM